MDTGSLISAQGGTVTQNFSNNSICIVNIHEQTFPSPCERQLIKAVHRHTQKRTNISVLADHKHEKFHEPDFVVHPKMRKVDVDDFYKGRLDIELRALSMQHISRSQLTEKVELSGRLDDNADQAISYDEILASIWKSRESRSSNVVGVTAIVGSAGSGKTTLTRRIATNVLNVLRKQQRVKDVPFHGKRMVHYIEIKNIEKKESTTVWEFLFHGLYQSEDEEKQACKWLNEHQSEVILIFDGLDQARWNFSEDSLRKIRDYDKASTSTIMYNILSRNILCEVKILISMREFKVSELPATARPETIITLNGLTRDDARKLFVHFLAKERGGVIWKNIEIMSPWLVYLVSVPLFLFLTVFVVKEDRGRDPPTSVTELYDRIVECLHRVNNFRNREAIKEILKKLKKIAFTGIDEGKVVFRDTDLTKGGLSAESVQDVMTKVPNDVFMTRYLRQDDFIFFFCHQSMQEFLAASYVAEMDFTEFSRFESQHLREQRWSVVLRFLTGILCSVSRYELHKVPDETKKRTLLAKSICKQLKEVHEDEKAFIRMELYTAVYEANNNELLKHHKDIDVLNIYLNPYDAHIIGSLANRRGRLSSLTLYRCNIDDKTIDIIATSLKHEITDVTNVYNIKVLQFTVRKTDDIKLIIEDDVTEIFGSVAGRFILKDSSLALEYAPVFASALYLLKLLDAEPIEFPDQHVYLKHNDLRELSNSKANKISKILIDNTKEERVDWSLIDDISRKLQVDVIDIAVDGKKFTDDERIFAKHGKKILNFDVDVNIHSMFILMKTGDVTDIYEASRRKKLGNIRCIISSGYRTSLNEVKSILKECNPPNLTMTHWSEKNMLAQEELNSVLMLSGYSNAARCIYHYQRENDAWNRLDEFFYRKIQSTES